MRAGQYRRTLDRISRNVADVARTVGRFLQGTDRDDAALDDAVRVLHPVIVAGREQSRQAAIAFTQAQARLQGYQGTVPVPAAREYAPESTKKALKDVVGGKGSPVPADMEKAVARTAVRHTEDAARKTVEDVSTMSTEPDPKTGEDRGVVRWARQLTGAENCPFCVVMASRGAIYLSRQTALYDGGDEDSNALSADMNRYHAGCDCVAVPVYDWNKWEGRKTAQYLYAAVYKAALEKYPDLPPFEAVRQFMIHDLDDDGLKVPQLRKDQVDVPDQPDDDVPDFVTPDHLSQETKEKIDLVQDRLPRTDKEWEEIRKTSGQTNLEAAREVEARYWERLGKSETAEARRAKDPGDKEYRKKNAKRFRDKAKDYRAGKYDEDVLRELEADGLDPAGHIGFERDKDGQILAPSSYLDRVDEVQDVGRAAMEDFRRAKEIDVELVDLAKRRADADREMEASIQEVLRLNRLAIEERRAARDQVPEPATGSNDDIDAWLASLEEAVPEESATDRALAAAQARGEEIRVARMEIVTAMERRQAEIIREIVGSRRPMGEKSDIRVLPGKANPKGYHGPELPAEEENLERIRKAATYFPKEWVQKMDEDRGSLYITTSPRGYYQAKHPLSGYDGDHINLSGERKWNKGAFLDTTEKTATHEVGHRMEKTLPAIARLEWAYLTRRATKNNKREALKQIPWHGTDEKAWHDEFMNAYTGKVYGNPDYNPWDIKGWEVFTTGLEALYGNDDSFQDRDEDLQSFILGLLLTV